MGTYFHPSLQPTVASVITGSTTVNTTNDAFGQAITQGTQTYTYDALGRVVTDAAFGGGSRTFAYTGTGNLLASDGTSTYSRAYDKHPGYLTVVSDGQFITGAHAIGPEAGEWLQQATVAIKARIPLAVMNDVIQPFPTFSEIYIAALKALRSEIAAASKAVGAGPPMPG